MKKELAGLAELASGRAGDCHRSKKIAGKYEEKICNRYCATGMIDGLDDAADGINIFTIYNHINTITIIPDQPFPMSIFFAQNQSCVDSNLN